MKYAIIGAGGTGGSLGFFLTKAGKDVTLIARGKHLEAIRKNGLGMERLWDHKREMIPVKACTVEEYSDTPDVILVCVKGYSMTETIPVIRKLAGKDTVVLPILNIYGTGGKLQKEFPELTVPDGCIYVSANILEPGVIGGVLGNVISLLIELRTQDFAVSAGASGAVFAVMGAMIYIVIRNKGWLGDLSMRQILVMAAFSLYFGFASTGVDNTAHVGGMVSGFFLAVIFYHPGRKI